MSFDVFLQVFRNGQPALADGSVVLALIEPHIAERAGDWVQLATVDGEADLFGLHDPGSSLTFSHVSGRAGWDLIFELGRQAGFAIMPVGCGTLLADEPLRQDLPHGVPEPIAVVTSGAEIPAVVESADG